MLTVQKIWSATEVSMGKHLLSDISLNIGLGQCVVINGASGSGKTMLLRALVDLDPNSGRVELSATPRDACAAPTWRQQVCYVPAEPGWWANLAKDHFANLASA